VERFPGRVHRHEPPAWQAPDSVTLNGSIENETGEVGWMSSDASQSSSHSAGGVTAKCCFLLQRESDRYAATSLGRFPSRHGMMEVAATSLSQRNDASIMLAGHRRYWIVANKPPTGGACREFLLPAMNNPPSNFPPASFVRRSCCASRFTVKMRTVVTVHGPLQR